MLFTWYLIALINIIKLIPQQQHFIPEAILKIAGDRKMAN